LRGLNAILSLRVPTTEWRSNAVSKKRLRKTGIFLEVTGDSWEFPHQKFFKCAVGELGRLQNPARGGPFEIETVIFSKTSTGWLGREDSNLRLAKPKCGRGRYGS
jgi:hypothetical protein